MVYPSHFLSRQSLISSDRQISLGELIVYLPIPGGHIKLAERFVDGAFSFAMGWNYWYNWTIILPAEFSAASVLVDFWDKNTKLNSLWIIICLFILLCSSTSWGQIRRHILLLQPRIFRLYRRVWRSRIFFASIKIITIVGSSLFALAHIYDVLNLP
jgi:amino acid permease